MTRAVHGSFLAAVVWLAASCSGGKVAATGGGADASSPTPTQGSERGHCYPDSTCNTGLECSSDLLPEGPRWRWVDGRDDDRG